MKESFVFSERLLPNDMPMNILNWILLFLFALMAVIGAGHALLNKRDPRAALGWIGVCLLFPPLGPFLYFLLGINRVRTRARKLHFDAPSQLAIDYEALVDKISPKVSQFLLPSEVTDIVHISDAVTRRPLVGGNRVEVLHNGEEAYPAMLEAIENAERSLFLVSYIFDSNATGRQFIDSLARAARRGVDVKVIIDGIGELYSIPRAGTLLERRGVKIARFLPPKLSPPALHLNLRNHRKILVADGHTGFTGGMNIGDRHLAGNLRNPSRVLDMHFHVSGPVVMQMEQVFLEDWGFVTGDYTTPLSASAFEAGEAICRTIVDGPNEDLDKLAMILVGAISTARRRVSIMTPYFLPSRELISALQTAALRGVEVTIILPLKNNLPYVQWAANNILSELLKRGVRIYYQPPPFVHTKLFLVDDHYAQIGSANLDPRSLRLNFEMVVEVYDKSFAKIIATHFENVLGKSTPISLENILGRSLPVRIRDALCWLFSPYL